MGCREHKGQGWPGAARTAARAGALVVTVVAAVVAAVALSGCAATGARSPGDGGLALRFEDRPAPAAFLLEADAVRDAPDGAAGLWAAVRGLERPERAEAVVVRTGKRVALSLYRAGRSSPAIRLSNEAADALGVADAPVNVRITALRRRPVVATR